MQVLDLLFFPISLESFLTIYLSIIYLTVICVSVIYLGYFYISVLHIMDSVYFLSADYNMVICE